MHIILAREAVNVYSLRTHGEPDPALTRLSSAELIDAVRECEQRHAPRWVFTSVEHDYPLLLEAGLRLRRCHDLSLAEGLLLAHEEREQHGRSLGAAHARASGLAEPEMPPQPHTVDNGTQPSLFEPRERGLPSGVSVGGAAEIVLRQQWRRIDESREPGALRMLISAESASALAAAEMSADGLPWRADIHRELLAELLGDRPHTGARPHVLADLATRVREAFDDQRVNPDHPGSILRAFARAGIEVGSTRAHTLREVEHPAVEPLLRYKELARLYSAHGWSWLDTWVRGERFRPVYVVGAVVSGRWASRGGAALQIPRALRRCVRADPGWKLVVADAAQLEPRILAALSGDRAFAEVCGADDLYDNLATALNGTHATDVDLRKRAKVAMLSAMYGGTAGEATALLTVLRQRFKQAVSVIEDAALAGERGGRVRSRLGRTSPAPSDSWLALTGAVTEDSAAGTARRASRDWGRFTRNFLVQASAADWTAVLLALLRGQLPPPAHLVFFQHDEVVVHTPAHLVDDVARCVTACTEEATALVFGATCPVRFPMPVATVDCYADAKIS